MKVRLHRDVDVAEVAVGDGRRGNALSSRDWRELERTFRDLARDDDLRAVVVRGQGGMFSSGSDMREWVEADVTGVADSFAAMEAAFTAIEDLPVPVIAQVEGVAAGAGCRSHGSASSSAPPSPRGWPYSPGLASRGSCCTPAGSSPPPRR
jgi:enoyl-CoA hydratase/carnithine racemase